MPSRQVRAAIAKLEPGEDRPPTQDGGFWVELLRITLDGWAEACEMALRWTGAGMLEAERQFRKIIGYRDLATLSSRSNATTTVAVTPSMPLAPRPRPLSSTA
jgi:hypothetical protein